ncbi:hypothetical protein EW026_g1150 [Hermanssonia centrifuga]|uniref:Uncharacterized protein n=1 Tax=Hermanssonia centrifuga TaxID=98765 RepID=A0A4S4KSG2_9APHY|nr:hypothetical protein EW026_g1150 [Hermanssonia centrifuga]
MLDMIDVHVRSYKFYFIMPSAPGPGNSIVWVEIIAIYIEEYKDGDSDKWNKTCDQLPTLQKLVLGFSSTEDMTHFVREVVNTKLDDLRSADRVKYAVLGENGWSRASSADSEELKETGLRVEDLWRI